MGKVIYDHLTDEHLMQINRFLRSSLTLEQTKAIIAFGRRNGQ